MYPQHCQHCPGVGIRLESPSQYAWVTYYRCFNGHVWQVSKDGRQERDDITPTPVRIITERLYA